MTSLVLVFIVVFVILLFIKLPLYVNLGLCSFLFIFLGGFVPVTEVQRITMAANSFTLIAAPFFIVMGLLMNTSGVTKKIFNFANVLVGNLPGGLGHTNILASVLFAGMSGTAVADAGGLGAIEISAMRDAGYDDDFSCAITAASSVIGPIVPPSFPMVIIAVAVEASIGRLFLGGILTGALLALSMMVYVYIVAKKRNYPRAARPTLGSLWKAFKEAFLSLLAPVILFLGIFSGIFTPTEASIVATTYSLILGVFVYKEIKLKDLPNVIIQTITTNGSVLALCMTAAIFGWVLSVSQFPQFLSSSILAFTSSKFLILLFINLLLLFVGMSMEATSAILILAPILIPIMTTIGVTLTQSCIIIIFNLMVGAITPPFGIVLFVVTKVGGISFDRVTKATAKFLIPEIVALLLVTYVPFITNWLPEHLM